MYYVTDQSGYQESFEEGITSGSIFKADTLEELGDLLQVPPAILATTVHYYNSLCEAGTDTDWNKDSKYLSAVSEAPYYAIAMLPVNEGTFGGPKTNLNAEVLSSDGQVISGLYAAGEIASGDLFYRMYPGDGIMLTASVVYGQVAGEQAAKAAV